MLFYGVLLLVLVIVLLPVLRRQRIQKHSDAPGPKTPKPFPQKPTPLSDAVKDALGELTIYGAFTPIWMLPLSIYRHIRRKAWWNDDTALPDMRRSGPWDTEDTRGDDVIDIVDIDFDAKAHWGSTDSSDQDRR